MEKEHGRSQMEYVVSGHSYPLQGPSDSAGVPFVPFSTVAFVEESYCDVSLSRTGCFGKEL